MRIDHVIFGCEDIGVAATRLEREHGLRFGPTGQHPGGTVNVVAPLTPPHYLELLSVERIGDDLTRQVDAAIRRGRTLLGWGIEVDDIDAVADRVGRDVEQGSVTDADGAAGGWQLITAGDLDLPFFINYGPDRAARVASWADLRRECGNEAFGGFTFVEVGGDQDEVRAWIGGAELPIRFTAGRGGLHSVGIAGPTGEIVIRDEA